MTPSADEEPPGAEATGLTTGAVARRLGVSPTTLRSWSRRYGISPAAHESGRHRRWTPWDIAVLEEMCRLTASGVPPGEAAKAARASGAASGPVPRDSAAPAGTGRGYGPGGGLPLGDVRHECRGLARAAVRLDAQAVETMLASLIGQYGPVTTWEEVMAPALRAVGRKWESSGDRYVEVEHLLSWHVSCALRRTPAAPRAQGGPPPPLLACVPDEQHTLPLEALAATLDEQGLPYRMFGAAVPVEALDHAVRRTGPSAVVLWSQSRSTANRPLAGHLAASTWGIQGARTHPAVLLAGPGWAGSALPGTLRPAGLRDAVAFLARIRDSAAPSSP